MQGHGLAQIYADQNKELICVDPCSSAALIIFSQLLPPVSEHGQDPDGSGQVGRGTSLVAAPPRGATIHSPPPLNSRMRIDGKQHPVNPQPAGSHGRVVDAAENQRWETTRRRRRDMALIMGLARASASGHFPM